MGMHASPVRVDLLETTLMWRQVMEVWGEEKSPQFPEDKVASILDQVKVAYPQLM